MTRHVLIACDDPIAGRLHGVLAAAGSSRIEVNTWEEALAHLESDPNIDLVVVSADILATGGPHSVMLASTELSMMAMPHLVVSSGEGEGHAWLSTLFRAVVPDTTRGARLVESVNSVCRGAAQDTIAPMPAASTRGPDWRGQSISGWFERALVTEVGGRTRVAVTMPSLTSGDLKTLPVARALYLLSMQRRTGRLIAEVRDQKRTISLFEGHLIGDGDGPEAIAFLSAFGWREGRFAFIEERGTNAETSPLLPFVARGIRSAASFNDIATRLAPHDAKCVATTTLAKLRTRLLGSVPGLDELIAACDGKKTIAELLASASIPLEDVFRALAVAITTDAIAFFPSPVRAPVGLSYRLREANPDSFASSGAPDTMARISKLDSKGKHLLTRLNAQRAALEANDPYSVFGVQPGCGREPLQQAFYHLLRQWHPSLYMAYAGTPVMVAAELVFSALQDAYQLAIASECPNDAAEVGIPAELLDQRRSPKSRELPAETTSRPRGVVAESLPRAAARRKAFVPDAPSSGAAPAQPQPIHEALHEPAVVTPPMPGAGPPLVLDPSQAPLLRPRAVGRMGRRKLASASSIPDAGRYRQEYLAKMREKASASSTDGDTPDTPPRAQSPPAPAARSSSSQPGAQKTIAKSHYKTGRVLLKQGKTFKAREDFSAAAALDPENGKYRAYEAWCKFQLSPSEADDVCAALRKAAECPHEGEVALLLLSRVLLSGDDVNGAKRALREAKQRNPRYADAERELRLLEQREVLSKSRGLLARVMGRDKE